MSQLTDSRLLNNNLSRELYSVVPVIMITLQYTWGGVHKKGESLHVFSVQSSTILLGRLKEPLAIHIYVDTGLTTSYRSLRVRKQQPPKQLWAIPNKCWP